MWGVPSGLGRDLREVVAERDYGAMVWKGGAERREASLMAIGGG